MKFLKLLLIPIFAFSVELKFDKEFYHEVSFDILSTLISIKIEDDTELIVNDRLEVFNKKIKSFDKVEKELKIFNIRPEYRHSSNTPKIIGYIGELSYQINSYKARYMDEFITEITNLKKNRDTTISVSEPSWKVKEDTYNVAFDLLRLQAINWIENYATNLSKNINKTCEVKKIDINKHITYEHFTVSNKKVYASVSATIPTKKRVAIKPIFLVECK